MKKQPPEPVKDHYTDEEILEAYTWSTIYEPKFLVNGNAKMHYAVKKYLESKGVKVPLIVSEMEKKSKPKGDENEADEKTKGNS